MYRRFCERQVRLVLVGTTHKDPRASVVSDFIKEKGITVNEEVRGILAADTGVIPRQFLLTLGEKGEEGVREATLSTDGVKLPYTLRVDERGRIDGTKFLRWLIGHHGLGLRTIKVRDKDSEEILGKVSPWSQVIQMLKLGFTEARVVEPLDDEEPGVVYLRPTPLGISWRAEDNGEPVPLANGLREWYVPPPRREELAR